MICLSLLPCCVVHISFAFLCLLKTVDSDITAHFHAALGTNSYNGVTFSRQTALHCSTEEI